ncbi:fibronectin type III domain-containing protein [Chitinophaga sp. HK235]|uniref:fibronectin type III domain-containing protein n=1 Tax=Chitinophaga sp. HK235 TaxID=2952571 RepID=UPI001BAC871F|nr:hypothetical protein [Chitinophaga sp. HK235]
MYRILFTGLLSVGLLLMGRHTASAQQQQSEHRIVGLANPKPGKIQLRWSPAGYIAWEIGNKYGYTVERFTTSVNGVLVPHPQPVLLTPQPLKPYTLKQMETAAQKDDRIAMVAELIYGEGAKKVKPEEGIGSWFENQSQNDWRMSMALLACDMSVAAARSAGLFLEDTTVRPGERYAYRISVGQQPKNLIIDTAIVVTALNEPILLGRPPELAIVCADSTATLGWLTNFNRGMYSAYVVERGTDGKTFRPVTDLPVVPTAPDAAGFSYYQDSLPDNDVKYYYRVKGITPFGEYGPYSQVVMGMGVPAVSERPIMDTIIVIDNKKIELRWLLPGDLAKNLSSIIVTRSEKGSGPYLPIATFKTDKTPVYSFTDPKPLASNYYKIKGITKRGKAIYSFPYFAQLIDTIPPAAPTGLAGTVDSTGVVTLKWDNNTEKDLKGYRVFRGNSAKEEFTEATQEILTEPTFKDTITLHTLTSKVFYKIIALDKNYNTSAYTAVLALKRPDTIAPSTPVFTRAVRSDSLNGVVLQWNNSTSEDVVKYTLYRINAKDSSRREVGAWDTAHLRESFLDTAVVLGDTYFYELMVWDDSGNKSKDISGDVWFETGKRPAVKNWKGIVDMEKKQVLLSWEYDQPDVKQYHIYRAKNDAPYILYRTIEGTARQSVDDEIILGNIYKYKITAVLKGDAKAVMSREILVKY